MPPSNMSDAKQGTHLPVFTYGTLRRGWFNYEKHLEGRTVEEQPARLTGCVLYDAGGFPFAVRKTDCDESIIGELMTIRPADYEQVLLHLDELEGHDPTDPGSLFKRVTVSVWTNTGSTQAWMYEAGDTVEQEFTPSDRIPGGDWASHQTRH
ncbi:gamma-glutamylcyclotransferase family protein [Lentzea flaviverrucosa]|nr:gamma-glutamylcyclotransferase family protein [Lentzea flaviverrucosa]